MAVKRRVSMEEVIEEKIVSRGNSATRSAAMNGAALATVALGSAIQVAFYLRDFGATHRTDGLIAAFAVYSLVVVLGQLLRTTAVPLLSGPRPAVSAVAFGWAIVLIAVVAAIVCAVLAVPLANVIAGASGRAGRSTAAAALRVMAPAIGLQLVGAGLAVGGALRDRLDSVALAYMASGVAGVVGFFALHGPAAEIVLAWTMLVASAVLVAGLLLGVGIGPRRPAAWRVVPAAALALVRSIPLPASFVVMYPLTLALAPHDRPGQITLLGLAFTACSYLAGFTGQALSMADAVALSRLDPGAAGARRALVIRAFRYSLLLAGPGLGIAAVAGAPIVRALLPSDSTGSDSYFGIDIVLLIPWLIATLAVWATLPTLLAATHTVAGRRIGAAVAALILLHVAAALIGRAVAGFDGVVLAMVIAPGAFVAVGLWIAVPAAAPQLLRPAVVVLGLGAVSFGGPELAIRALSEPGPVSGIVAALAGALVYAGLAARAYPDAARTFRHLAARK
jgi:hypothetical protein